MNEERDPGGRAGPPAENNPPFGVDRGDRVHEFEGKGIRVTWSRRRCTHAAACVMNLPTVFEPGRRPWVDPMQASPGAVARVVPHCPTGALHFLRTDGGPQEAPPASNTVLVARRGPLNLRGDLEVFDEAGVRRLTDYRAALCRCGRSENKPFCDGSHRGAGFADEGGVPIGAPLVNSGVQGAVLRVRPEPGGPLHLEGPLTLLSANGQVALAGDGVLLCRCGGSSRKPFCDGTHRSHAPKP